MDSKKDIKSLNLEELKTELESMGEKAFRAKQMYEWMHVKLARSFDEMTNLSAKFREQCKEKYEYTCVKPVRIQESKIDGTKKFYLNCLTAMWWKACGCSTNTATVCAFLPRWDVGWAADSVRQPWMDWSGT